MVRTVKIYPSQKNERLDLINICRLNWNGGVLGGKTKVSCVGRSLVVRDSVVIDYIGMLAGIMQDKLNSGREARAGEEKPN